MKTTLDLLHLSDLHICDTDLDYLTSVHGLAGFLFGGPALKTDFSRLRSAVESRADEMDWLIITGDITHTGRIVDLVEAREFVRGMEGDFAKRGAGFRSLALMPGNHDRYKNKGPDPGNVGPFEDKFDRFWNIGQGAQFQILSQDLRVQAGFADFSLQEKDAIYLPDIAEWGRRHPSPEEIKQWIAIWGNGCVYENLLEELSDASASRIAGGWNVVWIIHFAPFPPTLSENTLWKLRLRNEENLIARARSLGVTHIFCGHTHQKDHYKCQEVEVFCAGPSMRDSRFANAHFFTVQLEVAEGRLITRSWEDVTRSLKSRNYVGQSHTS